MANTRILFCFFLIVFSTIKCDVESDCEGGVPSEKHECFDRIDEDYKEQGWHCCFLTYKTEETEGTGTIYHECGLLESDDYDDIEYSKKKYDLEDIECHQSYLKLNKFKYIEFALMNLFLLLIIM